MLICNRISMRDCARDVSFISYAKSRRKFVCIIDRLFTTLLVG